MDAAVWAKAPDDKDDALEIEAHGKVDETFATRKLRRWLKGMFGGGAATTETPAENEQEH